MLRRLLGFLGLLTLQFFMIMAGSLFLAVPGIFLMLATGFAIPVFLIEGTGVVAALERSIQLSRGHLWRILLLAIAVGLLVTAVQSIPMGALAMLVQVNLRAYTIGLYLWGALAQTFLHPIQIISMRSCTTTCGCARKAMTCNCWRRR